MESIDLERRRFIIKTALEQGTTPEIKRVWNHELPPLLHPDDYYTLVEKYLAKSLGLKRTERRYLKQLLNHIRKLISQEASDPLFLQRLKETIEQEKLGVWWAFWDIIIDRLNEKGLHLKVYDLLRKIVERNHFSTIAPSVMIFPSLSRSELKVYFVPSIEELLRDEKTKKRAVYGWAHALELPHLNHLSFEELERLLLDEEVHPVLFDSRTAHILKKIENPVEVLRELSRIEHRDLLMERAHRLPPSVFDSEVLREFNNIDRETLKAFLDVVAAKKKLDVKKVVKRLRENPEFVFKALSHPLLTELMDEIAFYEFKLPGVTDILHKNRKHLKTHTKNTLLSLLEAAAEKKTTDGLELLIRHPDLYEYYHVLVGLDPRILSRLLEEKETWKGIEPELLERSLTRENGIRVLLSSIPLEKKREILYSSKRITKEYVKAVELATKHRTDERTVLSLLNHARRYNPKKYVDLTAKFLEKHKDLVALLDKRELRAAFHLFLEKEGKELSSDEIKVLMMVLDEIKNPIHAARIISSLKEDEIAKLAEIPQDVLRYYLNYVSRSIEEAPVVLKRFLRDREETTRKVRASFDDVVEDLRQRLLKEINYYDPRQNRVSLNEPMAKELGVGRIVTKDGLTKAISSYLRYNLRLDDDTVRRIMEKLDIDDILGARDLSKAVTTGEPSETVPDRLADRLYTYLNSIYKALTKGHIRIKKINDDVVVFEVRKKTHNSKAILDSEFGKIVKELGGEYKKTGQKTVHIGQIFFQILSSHGRFTDHPLISFVRVKTLEKLWRKMNASPRSRRGKSSRRRSR